LLSERDLPLRVIEERAFIDYLGPQDEPWVRVLLAEMARFEGRRRRELAERLAEPLPCEAPHFKRRAATRALLALWRREPTDAAPVPLREPARSFPRPAALRQELFGARRSSICCSRIFPANVRCRRRIRRPRLPKRCCAPTWRSSRRS
jgi:hypothetical protein